MRSPETPQFLPNPNISSDSRGSEKNDGLFLAATSIFSLDIFSVGYLSNNSLLTIIGVGGVVISLGVLSNQLLHREPLR